MSFATQLTGQVDDRIQSRGRSYYRRGAVRILEGDAWSVQASVQGTSRYEVGLTRNRKAVKAWCTCPYFQGGLEPCKHIWATLLAAEAQGYLRGSGEQGRLRLIGDEGGGSGGNEGDGWEYEDEEYGGD